MTLTIGFLGDTLLGDQFQDLLRERGYGHALAGLAPLLARADVTVANHEGVLTSEGRGLPGISHRKRFWMRADPESAAALADRGVTLVSLANNHVLDYGLAGLADTIATLDEHGIRHCGAGLTEAAARRPVVLSRRGVRVGFLSCIQRYDMYAGWLYAEGERGGCNRLRAQTIERDLGALAGQADVRIVLVHWGRNYQGITPTQQRWAPRIVAAGADLVIGHHPHVVHPVDVIEGCPVVYSLGNGSFGTQGRFARHGQPPYGVVVLAEIDGTEPGAAASTTTNGASPAATVGAEGPAVGPATPRPPRLFAVELHLIDVDNRLTEFRPVVIETDDAVTFLRSLTAPEHGWYQRGYALRLELPSP